MDDDKQLVVALGKSANAISLEKMIVLFKASENKIILDLSGTNLQRMFDRDATYKPLLMPGVPLDDICQKTFHLLIKTQ